MPRCLLLDAELQTPNLGTVILSVVRQQQLDERLVGGEVKFAVELADERAQHLEHADADLLDVAQIVGTC